MGMTPTTDTPPEGRYAKGVRRAARRTTGRRVATHGGVALVVALITYALVHAPGPAPAPTPVTPAPTTAAAYCDASLWDHVYNPQRLHVVQACTNVTGVVQTIRREADGDDHIQLAPDAAYAGLVNDVNRQAQGGYLVLEIICQHLATQADAIPYCTGYQNQIPEPSIGAHILATGSYVTDAQHGGWAEIHPISSLTNLTAPP